MATYVIGDVQGCFPELQQLLNKIDYQPTRDALWFTGDLVNRGPQSLETLRFIKQLPASTVCVMGNHDFALLAIAAKAIALRKQDLLQAILDAEDRVELLTWLRHRPLLHYDPKSGFTLSHAGIYPAWDLTQARLLATEVEIVLRSSEYVDFLQHLYGDEPNVWNDNLTGWDRLRFICNAFTRMRFVSAQGELILHVKTSSSQHSHLLPWFAVPTRRTQQDKILFGHWAALQGKCESPNVYALDTGCVWGNCLTAFCLENQQRTVVACQSYRKPDPL